MWKMLIVVKLNLKNPHDIDLIETMLLAGRGWCNEK